MPVFFYVDPEFATDPRLKGVDNLTLSYTFFKVMQMHAIPMCASHDCLVAHQLFRDAPMTVIPLQVDEDKETPQEALARILAAHPDQHSELLPRPHT